MSEDSGASAENVRSVLHEFTLQSNTLLRLMK